MAEVERTKGYAVGKVSTPAAGKSAGMQKGHSNVAGAKKPPVASSAKEASTGVKLGTTHGNHNVAHPIMGN